MATNEPDRPRPRECQIWRAGLGRFSQARTFSMIIDNNRERPGFPEERSPEAELYSCQTWPAVGPGTAGEIVSVLEVDARVSFCGTSDNFEFSLWGWRTLLVNDRHESTRMILPTPSRGAWQRTISRQGNTFECGATCVLLRNACDGYRELKCCSPVKADALGRSIRAGRDLSDDIAELVRPHYKWVRASNLAYGRSRETGRTYCRELDHEQSYESEIRGTERQ
jgi:hypothetical protein